MKKRITVMQQKCSFTKEGALKGEDITLIPKTATMVRASTLAKKSEKTTMKYMASLLVDYEDKQYIAHPNSLVPSTATLVRNDQEALVGFPAIAGG